MSKGSSGMRRLRGGGEVPPASGMAVDLDEMDGGLPRDIASLTHTVNLGEDDARSVADEAKDWQRPGAVRPVPQRAMEDHYANLAAYMSREELQELGRDLAEEVRTADESRSEWSRILADGIKKLGFDRNDDTRSEPFKGASAVVHPAFAQACIEGQARAEAKLSPPDGPCKTSVVGEPSEEATERADRVADYINWQTLHQMPEWCEETERLLMMVWAEGSSFKKVWYDRKLKRPCSQYLRAEDVIMPYGENERMSPLVAEKMRKTDTQARALIKSGMWIEHNTDSSDMEGASPVQEAADRAVGVTPSQHDVKGRLQLVYFECQVTRSLRAFDDGEPQEYIVTFKSGTNEVVAVYRNWSRNDPMRQRRALIHHYRAFPWRGSYGIGLLHLIGGLAKAATGALRALLDSGHWQNMPGGFRLKASRGSGAKVVRAPGDYVELEAPSQVKDIRELIMQDPHQGPSPVLMELLGFLTDQCKGFASIALQEVAETNANVPVGTTMARLDEASRVYAGVFRRLHRSQGRELQALYDIDAATIDDQMQAYRFASPEIMPDDFAPGIQVIPVSDPNSHSQIQESLTAQARLDLGRQAMADGVNVDMRDAYVMAGKGMHLPNMDELFPEPPEPLVGGDPFTENAAIANGTPAEASPTDDHDIHLEVHLALLLLPGTGASPAGASLLKHMMQHLTMGALTHALAGSAAASVGMGEGETNDAAHWYRGWIEQMAPLIKPAADADVQALADAEKLKAELKQQTDQQKHELERELLVATEAAKSQFAREEQAAELQTALAEINAKHAAAMAEIGAKNQATFASNASRERVAAAQIGAKAAEPPRPPPMGATTKRVAPKKRS